MTTGSDGESDSAKKSWKKWTSGPRMWGAATALAVLVLWAGTQLMIAFDRDPAWYTGFGQWLGALGSLIAAAVALGIATTDRRNAANLRKREREDRDADLIREAGLVRVEVRDYNRGATSAVAVKNWRRSRIFEIEVLEAKTADTGTELEFERRYWWYTEDKGKVPVLRDYLHNFALSNSESLWLVPREGAVPKSATLRYTDESGRRWQVDTEGNTRKLP
ncbi:hypothetical protein [Prescottella equi]